MKKIILILIGIVFINALYAQDVIFKKNGDEIYATGVSSKFSQGIATVEKCHALDRFCYYN